MLVDSSISVVGLGYLVATHPTEASIAKYSFHVALMQQTYRENKEHAVRKKMKRCRNPPHHSTTSSALFSASFSAVSSHQSRRDVSVSRCLAG